MAGRIAIGLKPLIGLYLFVLLGSGGLLLGGAAVRILRHALISERAQAARELLREIAAGVGAVCPELAGERACPRLGEWTRLHRKIQPALQALSIQDDRGRWVASSDPARAAQALWDALGGRAGVTGEGGDWLVTDCPAGSCLVVEHPAAAEGFVLRGSFDVQRTESVARRAATSVMLYAALVTVALMALGWMVLYRLIVRPVDRLLQAAGRISEQGDLSYLLAAERGSELGRLGVSLGRMARRIEQDQRRLVEQIGQLETLNRHLEQAQQMMIRQEKLASVGFLAAGLAHEVGNPISAIAGYVGMLRTERLPAEEQADILARVEREVERIDKTIRDLLAYSRPSRGEVRPCTPAEMVDQALDLIRPQKKFKRIALQVQVPEDLPAVQCDPDRVRQVLVNLLFNALDEVADSGHIWVRAAAMTRDADGGLHWPGTEDEPDFFALGDLHRMQPPCDGRGVAVGAEVVVFSVADDGLGIAASDLGRIFDPFFTTKAPARGTGLGLALCHTAIQSLGGEIWAWSRENAGTQLAFWLPVA